MSDNISERHFDNGFLNRGTDIINIKSNAEAEQRQCRGNKSWSYLRKQLQLTNISYRRGERRMKMVDSESSSDRRKVTDCNSPRDSFSIRCFFRRL